MLGSCGLGLGVLGFCGFTFYGLRLIRLYGLMVYGLGLKVLWEVRGTTGV